MFRRTKELVVTGGRMETVIGPNTSVNGHLEVDGNLRIQGLVEGAIQVVGNLIIGEGATVKADISAHAIQVWGTVEGSINASDKLEILHTGRVFADVEVGALHIDDNAVFRGKCVIRANEIPELQPEQTMPQQAEDEKLATE